LTAVYCNPLPKLLNGTLTPAGCSQAKSRFGEECNATCLVRETIAKIAEPADNDSISPRNCRKVSN
jgi:hypothetical protein